MNTGITLGIIAGIGYAIAYLDYNRGVFRGHTQPNAATWAIWSAICLLSASSYLFATGDYWKCILPGINIVMCIGTFVLSLACGKFRKLDTINWIALLIGLSGGLVWIVFKSASHANLIVQCAITVGFIPTWRSIWATPSCEHPRPWWIWSSAYFLSIFVVILRWNGNSVDLVYPIANTFLHGSIPIICYLRR